MCVLLVCDGELSLAIRPNGIENSCRHRETMAPLPRNELSAKTRGGDSHQRRPPQRCEFSSAQRTTPELTDDNGARFLL